MASPSHKEDHQEEEEEEVANLKLPNDLFERILSLLPINDVLRGRIVCKRWRQVLCSPQFIRLCSSTHPWYFMFRGHEDNKGVLYDPSTRMWHSLTLPSFVVNFHGWIVATSGGLVCFTNVHNYNKMYIGNPLTHSWRQLPHPTSAPSKCYINTVGLSVDPDTGAQTVIMVRSVQAPRDNLHKGLLFDVYHPVDGWHRSLCVELQGWCGDEQSVICNGVLYCLVHSTTMMEPSMDQHRHGVLAYRIADASLSHVDAKMPCSFSCVKLIDCKGRLVMVGGIVQSEIIKGIGVWELYGGKWKEISQMPIENFRCIQKDNDSFSCSGTGDLIYIHSYDRPLLLLFNMVERTWHWSHRSPLRKKYDLPLFVGFCFEPNVGATISPS